jgi:hypothetical protein
MHYRHYYRMKFFVGKLLHNIPILLFEETFYSIKEENFQEQAHESKYIVLGFSRLKVCLSSVVQRVLEKIIG